MKLVTVILGTLLPMVAALGSDELSDAQIQSAIERGKAFPSKKIWEGIKKKQQVVVNRAGLDPIEKKVTLLFAEDRIAMEAAEATRQLREVNGADIKGTLASPVTEVLLEANCYNNTYRGLRYARGSTHRIGKGYRQRVTDLHTPGHRFLVSNLR